MRLHDSGDAMLSKPSLESVRHLPARCLRICSRQTLYDRDGAPTILRSIYKDWPWLRHVFADRGHADCMFRRLNWGPSDHDQQRSPILAERCKP
jgi:hypothetical protein